MRYWQKEMATGSEDVQRTLFSINELALGVRVERRVDFSVLGRRTVGPSREGFDGLKYGVKISVHEGVKSKDE